MDERLLESALVSQGLRINGVGDFRLVDIWCRVQNSIFTVIWPFFRRLRLRRVDRVVIIGFSPYKASGMHVGSSWIGGGVRSTLMKRQSDCGCRSSDTLQEVGLRVVKLYGRVFSILSSSLRRRSTKIEPQLFPLFDNIHIDLAGIPEWLASIKLRPDKFTLRITKWLICLWFFLGGIFGRRSRLAGQVCREGFRVLRGHWKLRVDRVEK